MGRVPLEVVRNPGESRCTRDTAESKHRRAADIPPQAQPVHQPGIDGGGRNACDRGEEQRVEVGWHQAGGREGIRQRGSPEVDSDAGEGCVCLPEGQGRVGLHRKGEVAPPHLDRLVELLHPTGVVVPCAPACLKGRDEVVLFVPVGR